MANPVKHVPLYPWLQAAWEQLLQSRQVSALLLEGDRGVGSLVLAEQLARWHLCLDPTYQGACGNCQSCLLDAARGTHPDAKWLVSVEEANQLGSTAIQLGISAIRALLPFTQTRPQIARKKVVLMGPLEKLNHNASNALLKSLEEPSESLHFILFSYNPGQLLPTVKSRCLRYSICRPPRDQVADWLLLEAEKINSDRLDLEKQSKVVSADQVHWALDLVDGWPISARDLLFPRQTQAGQLQAGQAQARQARDFLHYITEITALNREEPYWLLLSDQWCAGSSEQLLIRLRLIGRCLTRMLRKTPPDRLCPFEMSRGGTVQSLFIFEKKVNQLCGRIESGHNYLNLKLQVSSLLVDWRRLVINTEC